MMVTAKFDGPSVEEQPLQTATPEDLAERISYQQWLALTEQLHNFVAQALPDDFQGLSDYAMSREGIYADHP